MSKIVIHYKPEYDSEPEYLYGCSHWLKDLDGQRERFLQINYACDNIVWGIIYYNSGTWTLDQMNIWFHDSIRDSLEIL